MNYGNVCVPLDLQMVGNKSGKGFWHKESERISELKKAVELYKEAPDAERKEKAAGVIRAFAKSIDNDNIIDATEKFIEENKEVKESRAEEEKKEESEVK